MENTPDATCCAALSLAPLDHRLERTGPGRPEFSVVQGQMMTTTFEMLFRSASVPPGPGDRMDAGLFRVERALSEDIYK